MDLVKDRILDGQCKLVLDLDDVWFREPGYVVGAYGSSARLCALGKLHAADGCFANGYDLYEKITGKSSSRIYILNDAFIPGTTSHSEKNHYKALVRGLKDLWETGKVEIWASNPKIIKVLEKAGIKFED